MPDTTAAPALPLPKHAHRPEPIEPPSAPPIPPPTPGEPDTVPSPAPPAIEPIEPVGPPIGDPPASTHANATSQYAAAVRFAAHATLTRLVRCATVRRGDFMYLLQSRRIFYRQFAVVTPRLY